jgi:hypothetical protein
MNNDESNPRTPKPKTRSDTICPIFGAPVRLSETSLPTYASVSRHYQFIRLQLQQDGRKKEPNVFEITNHLASDVERIWNKASIPVVSPERITHKLREYHKQYQNMLRGSQSKHTSANYETKLTNFQEEGEKLFDIASCKCVHFADCTCKKEKKVPKAEQSFLIDQRTCRKMVIGNLDVKETTRMQKRLK